MLGLFGYLIISNFSISYRSSILVNNSCPIYDTELEMVIQEQRCSLYHHSFEYGNFNLYISPKLVPRNS